MVNYLLFGKKDNKVFHTFNISMWKSHSKLSSW